jgi:hypothetical protein
MHGLLLSLWLGVAPPPSNIVPGQERIEGPAAAPAPAPAPTPPPTPPPKRELSKGRRLLIASAITYGVGSSIQWATAGGTGMLADAHPGGTSGVTLGMTLGGMALVEGALIGGIAGRQLARERHGHDPRGKSLLVGGAVLTGLGSSAVIGTMMFWPSIRRECPIGIGCALAGVHVGGAALSIGAGMMAYGSHTWERERRHSPLSKRAQTPLIAGGTLLVSGYLMSASIGMAVWQADPDDGLARRTRNRMLIPVVGPWIHAAGPDAPLIVAVITGGLGALQIGGAIALLVGGALAGRERRRGREHERLRVHVVPSFDGVSIVGQF